ncbi:TPA: hypothetical protein QCR16_003186 [Bacillus cereus]|nr:hypothetical protein [Bacillus cereus]HDR4747501.1 hypothetical protein [Bacillus cereus]
MQLIQEGIFCFGGDDQDQSMKELQRKNDLDCWIQKANSLFPKINKSIHDAMINSNIKNFSPTNISEEAFWAYFHNENAIFRLACLWDVLAQMCNEYFELGFEITKVNYKVIFNGKKCSSNNEEFIKIQNEISTYFKEKDDTNTKNIDDIWKGNHTFISNIRNKFTHRNDPHIVHFFNNANNPSEQINFPNHPIYELKRITEDYFKCYSFMKNVNALMIKKYGSL